MQILIKSAKIIDKTSRFHLQTKDILVKNGIIKAIEDNLPESSDDIKLTADDLLVSVGWLDMQVDFADPGFEHRETIASGCRAAAKGGFTAVATTPNTLPVVDNKSVVNYLVEKSNKELVDIFPMGAVSKNMEGKELAEIYDMFLAGAKAFTDDKKPIANANLVKLALLYLKSFNGVYISFAEDKNLTLDGVMNEGHINVSLGLKGMPEISESLIVARDLELAKYTEAPIHFANISTEKSIDLIRQAKRAGQMVTCGVNAYNLLLDDTLLPSFDTNFKVNPPLRSQQSIKALIAGIKDGTVDVVTSDHRPFDPESKQKEFDLAAFGMIGLESMFGVLNTALRQHVTIEKIIDLITINPRSVLHLTQPTIEIGQEANLTLFSQNQEWTFTLDNLGSLSQNTPLIGKKLIGKPLAVINKGKIHQN